MKRIKFERVSSSDYALRGVLAGLDEYLRHEHRVSPYYRATITRSVGYIIKKYGASEPSLDLARRIRDDLEDRGASTRTIALQMYYLEYWAGSLGVKLVIPDKPNRLVQRKDYLTLDEVRAMLDAAGNVRNYTILKTFLHTGLRNGLLCACNMEDVDLHRDIILVNRASQGNKNREDDYVLVSPELHEDLDHWLHYRPAVDTNALFYNELGHRFTPNGVRQLVHDIGVAAGIKRNVYPHLVRATMATMMDAQGWGIKVIQRQMLQKDPRSTMVYLRSGERELREKLKLFKY